MYINTLFNQGPRFKQGIRDTELCKTLEVMRTQNQKPHKRGKPFEINERWILNLDGQPNVMHSFKMSWTEPE